MDIKDNDRARVFSRRAVMIGGLQIAALGVLGTRLGWLQIYEGSRYKTLAEQNRINIKLLTPSRGQIVDRFGVPLAVNNQDFRAIVIPEQTDDLEKSLRALQKMISLDERSIARILKQAGKSPSFMPLEIRDDLSWPEVARIEVNIIDLPGISIDTGEIRSYPFGTATAHLIGYVGSVSKAELTDDPVLSLPGFRIGKTGLEKTYDLQLRGSAGNSEVEVNVLGREVRELRRNPGVPGQRVTLTLDAELQRFVQQRLDKERSACAVIMDVHSGDVYALASSPSFDPNIFSRGISAEDWEELLSDPTHPLTNKAVAGQYPPGSTFKMVTALAGLKAGTISQNTRVFCPGHYEFGKGLYHCWKKGGHGTVDLINALAQSCDTFFYKISTDIGIDRIADMARSLGLGDKLGFELAEEAPGLIPNAAWKKSHLGESWQPGETVVAAIGQGYIQATPLQLAVMVSRLVNGGYAVKPHVTGSVGDTPIKTETKWPKLDFDPFHLELIGQGMTAVVNGTHGTALSSRIKTPGMEMGGKTGTAQVRRITMQDRLAGVRNEDLPWPFRHHALFVGYAPLDNPRYACAVVVEHGGGGSSAAAPLARDIMVRAQERDPASKPLYRETVTPAANASDNDRTKG